MSLARCRELGGVAGTWPSKCGASAAPGVVGGVLFEKVCPGAAENEVHFHKVSQVRWVHAAGHRTGALCNTASGWRRTMEGVVTALARRLEK